MTAAAAPPPTRSVYLFTDTDGFGGAEVSLLTLTDGLDRRLWRPTIVCHRDAGGLIASARDHRADVWTVPRMPEGRSGARRMVAFARRLRARRPAVFHAHLTWQMAGKYGLLAALAARVPLVTATYHLFVETPSGAGAIAQRRLIAAAGGPQIAVSAHVRERLVDAIGLAPGRVTVIPNGIADTALTRPGSDLRRALTADAPDATLLVCAARLVPEKGLDVLIDAVARLDGVHLAVAGEGPEGVALRDRADGLGIASRVHMLGHRDDVAALLGSADVVAIPSRNEGFPYAVLEAMAAARPIVATTAGGIPELIRDGATGRLVEPGDARALACALRQTLADPSRAAAMGRAARATVLAEHSAQRMTERVTTLYRRGLDQR